ncbi:DNA-directed DNA polymerase [Lentibacillus sp. JNUCC-1]|uniref:DNA polymerase IV n=1 Tax=Lentibacillus sp. JNUCC-1 TaxID=2654513 RepID=UPI0012E82F76|nr:DNA polymerase IV [Lentibacillus sp. JNUCC-1]MUV39706.1 DNA-directed DNA polymerase [Lentibacillus sp. JNUCC-1]
MSTLQNKARIIFHIDMNCFYASVEMAYNPDLKGKALAIAGNPEERKGIVVTSSYEARAKGVKTTMPLWEAKKLCPELLVMRPNFDRYRAASKQLFQMLADITPLVEPVSIDEGYLDVTDVQMHPVQIAEALQKNVLDTLDLPCSIGIGPNKFLAKMASDMKKPLGITILRKRDLPVKLWPEPIETMYGVGDKTAEKLKGIKITTIGELAKADRYSLKQVLGVNGERLKNRANGIDPRPVDPESVNEFKSIGSSQTLPHDTTDEQEIVSLIHALADNVERRLKRKEAAGRTVQIMIRYDDRQTVTRSRKLQTYIDNADDIKQIACDLFFQHWNENPVRLIGVTLQEAAEKAHIAYQLDLFTYQKEEQKAKLQSVVENLSKKYGSDTFKKMDPSEGHDIRTSFQKDFLDDYRKK